jgi:hypothetical protein
MSDPQYKNPSSGGLTLAGGGTPRIRAYRGRNPYHPFEGVWSEKGELLGKSDDKGIWDKYEDAGAASWDDKSKFSFGPHPVAPKSYTDPDGNVWDSEDAYKQSGMAPTDMAGNKSGFIDPKNPTASGYKVTPSDVKANAAKAMPPTNSIAEQQADYIRSRGGRTAAEADAEFESNLRKDYSEATGFDINTAEGRRKSFQAALQRGGHADAMARNLRAGKYEYLDPNSDAGMKASEAARQKLFTGNDWVGENQLTGEFRDNEGNSWDSYDAFAQSGALNGTNNYPQPVIRPEEPTFSWV